MKMKQPQKLGAQQLALLLIALMALQGSAWAASWTNAATMTSRRLGFTLTQLLNGRVIAIGGQIGLHGGTATATTEIYNPLTDSWTYSGSMHYARTNHTATRLLDGSVLVTGGDNGDGNGMNSAEVYNPLNGSWSNTEAMHYGRTGHTAILLPNGNVLVISAAYSCCGDFPYPEIYDPHTRVWTVSSGQGLGDMAAILPNGMVLTRGYVNEVLDGWYLYNPYTDVWSEQNEDFPGRNSVAAGAALLNGRFLVTGGLLIYQGPMTDCEYFDPSTLKWVTTGSMNTPRMQHMATRLFFGTVLAFGGSDGTNSLSSAEIYNPGSENWTPTTGMNQARDSAAAILLPNRKVLVVGGETTTNGSIEVLATAELYNP